MIYYRVENSIFALILQINIFSETEPYVNHFLQLLITQKNLSVQKNISNLFIIFKYNV